MSVPPEEKETLPTREQLLARVSDVLRRSGIEDAEVLVRMLEQNLPPVLTMSTGIRTDGVYRSVNKFAGDAWKYIRFFDDGTAATVSSTAAPDRMESLGREQDASVGKFLVIARKVSFPSTDRYGTVNYEGMLLEDGMLRLRWHSLINGNSGEDTYGFHPFDVR